MNFRNALKRGLAALGLASVSLGAAPAQQLRPTHAAKPAMWKLADRDTTIYLFGTIHMLPKDYAWRTSAFEKAVDGSHALVVETIIDEAKPEQLQAEIARLAFNTPNLPPLAKRIAPEKLPLLTTALAKLSLPPNGLDKMETWAAAFILLGPQLKDLGVSGGEGVETVLRKRFSESGRPVMQLETNGEQLGFFDTLPEAAQRELLEGSLEEPDAMRQEFGGMLSAWARGDVNAIAKSFNKNLSTTPDLKDALIKRRNTNWSHWISRRMSQPGTVLVAVGAGHLAGQDSVQELLKKSGYRVRRVQ